MGSIRTWGGARSRPSMCCGRCCCRCSSRCGRSGNWSSRSTTTYCFANHAVFSKNRDRLLTSEVAQRFFAEVNERAKPFMSDDHFTVDGTLIQAWASHKSFRPEDSSDDEGGDGSNFHGRKRSNDTHESTTDPDARLYKKSYGKESHRGYLGHALGENRNGLVAAAVAAQADGYAEREAALLMLKDKQKGCKRRITAGADRPSRTGKLSLGRLCDSGDQMDYHQNARLTVHSREQMARRVVVEGLTLKLAAASFNVSEKTAAKWVRRYREAGC